MEGGSQDRPPHTISPASFLGVWCERLSADPAQQWGNKQINQHTGVEQARPAVSLNKEQFLIAKHCISFPPFRNHTLLHPWESCKTLLNWSVGLFLLIPFWKFPLEGLGTCLQRANLQNNPGGTNLACKFFRIQHERFMGTGLLGDILSAVKLKNLLPVTSFQSKSHGLGNSTKCPGV